MKTRELTVILLSVLLISSGCKTWKKADTDARAVALVTSQRVLTIKEELKIKIAAERHFYKSQLDTIEKSKVRSDVLKLDRDRATAALHEADELVRNKAALSVNLVASRVVMSSTNALADLRARRDKQREQRLASESSIRQLQLLEKEYDGLNKTLIQLTIPPSARDQMKQVASFIQGVADNYRRLKKEAEKAK